MVILGPSAGHFCTLLTSPSSVAVKKVASLIITVVSRPLDPNSLKQTLMEVSGSVLVSAVPLRAF